MSRIIKQLCTAGFLASACTAGQASDAVGKINLQDAAMLRELRAACMPNAVPGTSLAHVTIQSVEGSGGDLPHYLARSSVTGSHVRIYHAPDLAGAAASRAACFIGLLDLLSTAVPGRGKGIAWSPMVLTHDANYIPPKRDGEIRWPNLFTSNAWDAASTRFLTSTMPHEEVHLLQSSSRTILPRWFQEGHADWAGLQVTEQVNPDLARKERTRRADDFRKRDKVHLGSWGGMRVKPEAIERQLSADDRARRDKDPTYTPSGPFQFGSGDFEQDMDDEAGRYGAALALFAGLEQRHGRATVQAWVSAVLDGTDGKDIVALAREVLGEDITPLLQ